MKIDITDQVEFGNNDDEYLPLTKCACGAKFGLWEFQLNIYEEYAYQCPSCNRKLIFENTIRVYEINNE